MMQIDNGVTLLNYKIEESNEIVGIWTASVIDKSIPDMVVFGVGAGTVRLPEKDFKLIVRKLYSHYFSR